MSEGRSVRLASKLLMKRFGRDHMHAPVRTLALACLTVLSSATGHGDGVCAYDPGSVETVKGVVVRVERTPTAAGTPYVHMVLRTDAGDEVPVALGPASVVERRINIRAGDRVVVTGARVVRSKPALIACEVRVRRRVVHLRDRHGRPLWTDPAVPP